MEPRFKKRGFKSLKTPCHLSPPPMRYEWLTRHLWQLCRPEAQMWTVRLFNIQKRSHFLPGRVYEHPRTPSSGKRVVVFVALHYREQSIKWTVETSNTSIQYILYDGQQPRRCKSHHTMWLLLFLPIEVRSSINWPIKGTFCNQKSMNLKFLFI